ncbi:phosphate ABC transporter permease PstA [Sphingosinicella microcystinivorans]|uniref:phosphate ABC transporter permease PstA n=1 Tax=Sphingosinicella microcystinivorans TaxID=335406 RepID=UPI0022F3C2DF|nr:phosphate ABC transporter permease PstA [Sphingosinicella microcystinivorans]WBX82687.1 phosphate ABC transporter permease PstA [Sphingosinicella microcystinivorans]
MNSPRIQTDWASPVMQARVRRRYVKERRFRFMGFAALALAGAFLLFLLGTIFLNGYTGFLRTEVKLAVDYDPFTLGIDRSALDGPGGENALNTANFQGAMNAAASARAQPLGIAARDIVSDGAWLALREAVRGDPDLIGKRVDVWVPTSGDFDLLGKGLIDRDAAEANRPVSDAEIAAFDRLKSEGAVRTTLNTTFLSMADSTSPELAGIWGAAKGSLLTLLVTLLLCFPIGVMTAIYLEEYAPKNRFTDIIEVSINNLAAVPSIIFGLLGLAVFLNVFGMPRSAPVVGGLTLALMTLPVIVIAGRIAIKSVPPSIRDAALGVGASPIQVVFHHVLPLALPGILTGTIIGMARALGETAPLLMIGMRAFVTDVPGGFTTPATVLPVQIFLWSDEVARGFVEKTSAAIIVLLVFLMLMNGLAIYLRNKFEKRW